MKKDNNFMRRALELAEHGENSVEPNPMVGCVLVRDEKIVGEGYHRQFGGPHAEVEAIRDAGERAEGSTCYVNLEPCSHHGKTPPCVDAILAAEIRRVVVAMRDPNPKVDGRGLDRLREEGVEVTEHVLETEARELNAPYLTRFEKGRPWVVAKWAMTLDGKTASWTGSSQWISGEASRQVVHQLRGRMDAIMIGSRTAQMDDSSLTVRLNPNGNGKDSSSTSLIKSEETLRRRLTDPTGPNQPLRIVLDTRGVLSLESRLVQTAREIPVLVVVSPDAGVGKVQKLQEAGCEILRLPQRIPNEKSMQYRERERDSRSDPVSREPSLKRPLPGRAGLVEKVYRERMSELLKFLGKRGIANLLVEGGSQVFGTLFDMRSIDEVHVFIAPKLIGGDAAVPAIGGLGLPEMEFAARIYRTKIETVDQDIYIRGRVRNPL